MILFFLLFVKREIAEKIKSINVVLLILRYNSP